jgi:hypothetical protein
MIPMVALGNHPVITVIILFIVFFVIFFLLIFGILRAAESRKSKTKYGEEEIEAGPKISANTDSKSCTQCGTSMPGIASFCPECGAAQKPKIVTA